MLTSTNALLNLQNPARVKKPNYPYRESSYVRLLHVLNSNSDDARTRIIHLSENKDRGDDRKKMKQTFKRFAGMNPKRSAHNNSEPPKPAKQPMLADQTTECLKQLYSTFCRLCRCVAAGRGGGFRVNVSLKSILPPTKADDRLSVNLYLLHHRLATDISPAEWREAYVRVFLER